MGHEWACFFVDNFCANLAGKNDRVTIGLYTHAKIHDHNDSKHEGFWTDNAPGGGNIPGGWGS